MNALPEYLIKRDSERPYFVSEADFQHAMAIILSIIHPKLKVWLEYPVSDTVNPNNVLHIDLCVANEKREKCFIELKYKTKEVRALILRGHSAQDVGRLEVLRDVSRLEVATDLEECSIGYVIILTNDHLYWTPPGNNSVNDYHYRIHDNVTLQSGLLPWNNGNTDLPHYMGNKGLVTLKKNYRTKWYDSHEVNGSAFRYLVFEIKKTKIYDKNHLPSV
jgi:hypothetical protein